MLLILTYWSFAFFSALLFGSLCLGRTGVKLVLSHWFYLSLLFIGLTLTEVIMNGNVVSYKLLGGLSVINISFGVEYNFYSGSMILLIELVSSFVLFYINGYSYSDLSYVRLIFLILLFKLSMLLLVMGNTLFSLFVGGELVGIVSFGLIIYGFTSMSNSKSAIQAMLMNKIGDLCILLALFGLYLELGGVDFIMIFDYFKQNTVFCLYVLLIIGCFAKSGQIGLHLGLPNAMAAPTPVSALLHSATMVTAGVYLGIVTGLSSKYLILLSSYSLLVLGSFGLIEYDYKRTIAYSTGSQLAYMFVGIGLGLYHLSFFHLLVHALFKSTLFLSSGLVLYLCSDEQDIRRLGGLKSVLPMGYLASFIGTLSILGFPFLGAYYSKEGLILGSWLLDFDGGFLLVFGIVFTSYYSYRVFIRVYYGITKLNKKVLNGYSKESIPMYVILFIMSNLVIYWSYLLTDIYNGLYVGSDLYLVSEFVGGLNDLMMMVMLSGIAFILFFNDKVVRILEKYYQSWGFEMILKNGLIKVYTLIDNVSGRLSDKGVNENLLVWGGWSLKKGKRNSLGLVYEYLLTILLYLSIICVIYWLKFI